jgi:hypothetical protein
MRLPLTLCPKSPLTLQAALLLGHAGAVAILWPIDLPLELQSAACSLLLASALAVGIRLRRSRLRNLTLRGDGRVELEFADGRRGDADVVAGSTVLAWLVILRIEMGDRKLALPISADMLNVEDFRQLRVWLRWRRLPEGGAQDYS